MRIDRIIIEILGWGLFHQPKRYGEGKLSRAKIHIGNVLLLQKVGRAPAIDGLRF